MHTDGWLDGAAATASLLGEELYDHTGDDGTDLDKFPLGHANLAANSSSAAIRTAMAATLASFFRDGQTGVAFSL